MTIMWTVTLNTNALCSLLMVLGHAPCSSWTLNTIIFLLIIYICTMFYITVDQGYPPNVCKCRTSNKKDRPHLPGLFPLCMLSLFSSAAFSLVLQSFPGLRCGLLPPFPSFEIIRQARCSTVNEQQRPVDHNTQYLWEETMPL